jgi:hypothetical protein
MTGLPSCALGEADKLLELLRDLQAAVAVLEASNEPAAKGIDTLPLF